MLCTIHLKTSRPHTNTRQVLQGLPHRQTASIFPMLSFNIYLFSQQEACSTFLEIHEVKAQCLHPPRSTVQDHPHLERGFVLQGLTGSIQSIHDSLTVDGSRTLTSWITHYRGSSPVKPQPRALGLQYRFDSMAAGWLKTLFRPDGLSLPP